MTDTFTRDDAAAADNYLATNVPGISSCDDRIALFMTIRASFDGLDAALAAGTINNNDHWALWIVIDRAG